jgi:glycosyltransferase involved in cell wall biosynthesis
VFAINTIVKESLAMRGIIASKIYVVGNGLDVRKIDLLREESRNIRKENKICFFSRLSPSKGVLDLPEILFEVLKRYPDYKLEIIGSVEKNVVEKINEGFKKYNCVNNVNILGFMDNKEEAFKRIMLSKVIIFPTYEEGWGLALFEAVLLKIPVIVYKLPIFDELFGENIESANVGNRKAFAEKIMFCLEPSNSLQVSKKVESCYEIAKKYDWSNVFNFEKQRIQLLL